LLWLCRCSSHGIAVLHAVAVRCGFARVSPCIRQAPGGLRRVLSDIWFAKLLREALSLPLRTSLRSAVVDLVDFQVPAGCVMAICSTPWSRVLAEWWRVSRPGLLIADGPWWAERTGDLAVSSGVAGLRRVVRRTRAGGQAVVHVLAAPRSRSCRLEFLGAERAVSLLPARLAAAAGVPLVTTVAYFERGYVRVRAAAPLSTEGDQAAVMALVMAQLEKDIRSRPAIWSGVLKHPRAA
jgi:hypothetical protein